MKAKAALVKAGEWVTGAGWDEGKLAEHRYVTAADLDAVTPNNPVWLMHTTGHYGVANSLALKLAGITVASSNPVAGTIDRDAHNNPTGVLKEESAMEPVKKLVPPITAEQMQKGILYIQQVLHSEGMTAVKDPDIQQIHWNAYKSVLDRGQLAEHICVLWHAGSSVQSARTAAGVGNQVYPQVDPAVYRDIVRLFHQNGVPVVTHAVGDRAIDWVVDTYNLVEQERPYPGLRHSIIHSNLPTAHALDVMSVLQKKYDAGYPEIQPGFLWWIGDIYAGNYGLQRDGKLEPFNTLRSRGILWSGGSDYSVTPLPARYGLWASMTRQTAKGTYGLTPFGTSEDVDIHTALRSYTAWGARQMFLEDQIGTLEVGKKADIAVWDRDLYASSPGEVKDLKCLLTLFAGEVVYRSPQASGLITVQ